MNKTIYGVRLHERYTEADPELATLMSSSGGECGPWIDMVTGHPEWCWDILDAMYARDDAREADADAARRRLQEATSGREAVDQYIDGLYDK